MVKKPKIGDYVIAHRYSDASTEDPYEVGFIDEIVVEQVVYTGVECEIYKVNNKYFRYIIPITKYFGDWFLGSEWVEQDVITLHAIVNIFESVKNYFVESDEEEEVETGDYVSDCFNILLDVLGDFNPLALLDAIEKCEVPYIRRGSALQTEQNSATKILAEHYTGKVTTFSKYSTNINEYPKRYYEFEGVF